MRWDRIREGLLADPMTPGATTDLRPVVQAARNEWRTQSPVNQTIGNPGFRDEFSPAAALGADIRGRGSRPQMPPTNPRMRGVLPELSDLAQGKAMGRPVTTMGEPPPQPTPIPGGDLPTAPPNPAPDNDIADAMKLAPLQNMQPVDSSYGDLFKKLRPYQ